MFCAQINPTKHALVYLNVPSVEGNQRMHAFILTATCWKRKMMPLKSILIAPVAGGKPLVESSC